VLTERIRGRRRDARAQVGRAPARRPLGPRKRRLLAERPSGIDLAPLQLRDLLALPGFVEGGETALDEGERTSLLELLAAARDALAAARERDAAALRPQLDVEAARLAEFAGWLRATGNRLREVLLVMRERLAVCLRAAQAKTAAPEAALSPIAPTLPRRSSG
jgi:uncharacterized protein YicC (UPF0701 family)